MVDRQVSNGAAHSVPRGGPLAMPYPDGLWERFQEVCALPRAQSAIARLLSVKAGAVNGWKGEHQRIPQRHWAQLPEVLAKVERECATAGGSTVTVQKASAPRLPFDAAGTVEMLSPALRGQKNDETARVPYVVRTLREMLTMERPPLEMVIEPWLPPGGSALIYGWRGCGKTWFLLSLALAIATGSNFLNWRIPRPRRVVYIDGEMPFDELIDRLRLLQSLLGFHLEDDGFLRVLSMMDEQQTGGLNLADKRDHLRIEAAIGDAEVVFFDNLTALHEGGDETWGIVQAWTRQERQRGRTHLYAHNANKGGEQRDTSKHEDHVHTSIKLEQRGDDDGAHFALTYEKRRSFYGAVAKPFEAQLLPDEGWRVLPLSRGRSANKIGQTGARAAEGENQSDKMLSVLARLLAEQPELPPTDAGVAAGVPTVPETAWRAACFDGGAVQFGKNAEATNSAWRQAIRRCQQPLERRGGGRTTDAAGHKRVWMRTTPARP